MTPAPPRASVIVVSRGRPRHLRLCLLALQQQDHPEFEVVVVACPEGLAQVADLGLQVKTCGFDRPNISEARNLGLTLAAAEVVAFIDDDAVAEPIWLSRLTAPFVDGAVAAAGGFVRGRNGISYQWRARVVDRLGAQAPLSVPNEVSLHRGAPGRAIKTEGTNCAFRRSILADMGGFDPSFAFYLDETDVNLRLAEAGHVTAIVPLAEVHHGTAPSGQRRADRVPRTLFDIGASTAVFLRKHAPLHDHARALTDLRREQRARLVRHMITGAIEPRDVCRLMQTLEAGLAEGLARPLVPPVPLGEASRPFLTLPGTGPRPCRLVAGPSWRATLLREKARRARDAGAVTTLLLLSPGPAYHRIRFTEDGLWEQRGGLLGRSDRQGPLLQFCRFSRRTAAEEERIMRCRAAKFVEAH